MKWPFFNKKSYYPADNYSKEYIEEVLNYTQVSLLTKIPAIFELLLTSSPELKMRAAQVLYKCVSTLNVLELSRLDSLFRERTSLHWSYDWKKENPESLIIPNMSEDEKTVILGLSSFHPNGYFREKALHKLAQQDTGIELPYLLLRCNDWVQEIRKPAERYIESLITPQYLEEIVKCLPYINNIDNNKVFKKVVQLLTKKESFPYLDKGTDSKVRSTRLACYQMMMNLNGVNKESIMKYYRKEKEPSLRLFIFNEWTRYITVDDFKSHYLLLKRDKSPTIRLQVLEKVNFYFPSERSKQLEAALLDKSRAMRVYARFLITKHDTSYDFAKFYSQMITANKSAHIAILCLGEVARKEHAELITPYLKHHNVAIVKAAIRALAMLDGETYKSSFAALLNCKHRGISKAATKAIATLNYEDMKEFLYTLYEDTIYDHTKNNTALLLSSLPKWQALIYIIKFYVNTEDENISSLGERKLVRWIAQYNRSFVLPTKQQIETIKALLYNHRHDLEQQQVSAIEFCLKGIETRG
ncbi:HEAT repeat domain-containing protein [Niallia taxi]|uniref:HEAT repeat domain-containing protein n=2 Tax=Niallia taxi TaxID=2499688 RepID=UPI00203D1670|nr:HEAT repeat domain-containing protein [Niallia taxi]MCM3213974.1 HEAT repeat domain-containing protein [Niallia taxi]